MFSERERAKGEKLGRHPGEFEVESKEKKEKKERWVGLKKKMREKKKV